MVTGLEDGIAIVDKAPVVLGGVDLMARETGSDGSDEGSFVAAATAVVVVSLTTSARAGACSGNPTADPHNCKGAYRGHRIA